MNAEAGGLPELKGDSDRRRKCLDMVEGHPGSHELKGSEHILLVDDEGAIAHLEKQMLTGLGYRVTERTSSLEALKVFEADPRRFDLVVTDMSMPNLTGILLASRILAVDSAPPVIVCTGFSEDLDYYADRSANIRGVLLKPVLKAELAAMVREVLDDNQTVQCAGPP